MSYASQANSVVLLDSRHVPLSPIFVWNDTRHIAPISELLVHALTGQWCGDQATTALLGIWDVRAEAYWPAAVDAAGIRGKESALPLRPGSIVGSARGALGRRLGLSPLCRASVGSLDHHAAALGVGTSTDAEACESSGTVLASLAIGPDYRPGPGLIVGPSWRDTEYYTLCFDPIGATIIDRFLAAVGEGEADSAAMRKAFERWAACATSAAAQVDLAEPAYSERLKQTRIGTAKTGEPSGGAILGQELRGIYESLTARLLVLVRRVGGGTLPARVVSTGGGARSDFWMQLKADICGVPFVRTRVQEPAAYGAAVSTAVAAGWYPSVDRCRAAWSSDTFEEFLPNPASETLYRDLRTRLQATDQF